MKTTKQQRSVIRANLLAGVPSWVCTGLLDDADEAEREHAWRVNAESLLAATAEDLAAANAKIEKLEQQLAMKELVEETERLGLYEWQCKACKGTGKEPAALEKP